MKREQTSQKSKDDKTNHPSKIATHKQREGFRRILKRAMPEAWFFLSMVKYVVKDFRKTEKRRFEAKLEQNNAGNRRFPALFGLSDTTWTCGLYHPNWLELDISCALTAFVAFPLQEIFSWGVFAPLFPGIPSLSMAFYVVKASF